MVVSGQMRGTQEYAVLTSSPRPGILMCSKELMHITRTGILETQSDTSIWKPKKINFCSAIMNTEAP